jgi:hypothetical protein
MHDNISTCYTEHQEYGSLYLPERIGKTVLFGLCYTNEGRSNCSKILTQIARHHNRC